MEQQFETQERNIVVTPQAERHLSKTAGWVLFMASVSALLLFANVVVLVLLYFGLEPKFNYIELTALLLLLVPFLLMVAVTYNMFSYSILVKKAINNRDSDALDDAMANKRLFWKHSTLYLILSFVIAIAVCLLFYFYHESLDIF